MKLLAGRPMVERQLERLGRCRTLHRIVVATSTEASDDPLAAHLKGLGVDVFRGSLSDVLGRYVGAAHTFGATGQVVRLTADCPLADSGVIDDCVHLHARLSVDYVSNGRERTYPHGLDVEAFGLTSWRLPTAKPATPTTANTSRPSSTVTQSASPWPP